MTSSRYTPPPRTHRRLILAGLSIGLLWLGLKAWRINQAAQSLLARQAQAETLLANGLQCCIGSDLDSTADDLIRGVRQDIVTLKQETAVFLPLTAYLGWLPRLGPLVQAAPALLDMADAGTETAVYAWNGLQPTLPLLQGSDQTTGSLDKLAEMVAILNTAQPELQQAQQSFTRFQAARARLGDPTPLPQQIETVITQLDPWLPLAANGLRLAPVLPALLGHPEPRRYLLIAQNEDELRPTGGFIAGAGLLTLQNGRITDLTFLDANYIDDWANKPYGLPPQPLRDFMLLDMFLFRDANFWPDFPTSAEMALALYEYGQDTGSAAPLDGAIAFDQEFMSLLMSAIGPVDIPSENSTITSANVIDVMRHAWAINDDQSYGDWIVERKSFIGTFAGAIMQKVQNDSSGIDPLYLGQQLFQALNTRHLQIYVRDTAVAIPLAALGWDGRLPPATTHDLLMVIDTNIGYNKVNLYINTATQYQVDLETRQATLTLTYTHRGQTRTEPCTQGTPYLPGIAYLDRAQTCYWNYLRLYTPPGTTLLTASRHTIPGTAFYSGQPWAGEAAPIADPSGLVVFANLFLLPWGETLTSRYQYQLPNTVLQPTAAGQQYHLLILKQAGTSPQPLQFMLQLPPNTHLLTATPTPTAVSGQTLQFDQTLAGNLDVTVTYAAIR